jgi:hypothetical protein
VIAPLMFLTMWKHSLGACSLEAPIDPESYINSQADIIIHGILANDSASTTHN